MPSLTNSVWSGTARPALLLLLFGISARAANLPFFSVLSDDPGAWPAILSSPGLPPRPPRGPGGESSPAEMFGFRRGRESLKVISLTDVHRPGLPIVWEKGLELP